MVALLLLTAAPAQAGYDRAAIEAGFCGGGTAEAGQRVLAGLAEAERDDLPRARGFVVAAQDRKVACPGAASPLLNLRSRAAYEFAAALVALLATPTPEARAAALPLLARRAEAIPAGLLDRAAHAGRTPSCAPASRHCASPPLSMRQTSPAASSRCSAFRPTRPRVPRRGWKRCRPIPPMPPMPASALRSMPASPRCGAASCSARY
jgi:hypothetical protein